MTTGLIFSPQIVARATPPPTAASQSEAAPTASSSSSSKVIITPHTPQLPVGPSGPLLGFYNPVAYDHAPFVRRDSQLEQQEAILLQQQQQQWLQAMQQKQQLEQMGAYTPLISHTGHIQGYLPTASLEQHGQHFSFPTPEEVMRNQQRLQWQEQQLLHGALIPVALERQGGGGGAGGGGGRADDPVSHLVHPVANMDALYQQQQQQLASLGLYGVTSEALDLHRQYEIALQWIQKDPSLIQHQHVQQVLLRFQQYQQQLALMQQLALQEQQQQSRMLQELMQQQQRDSGRPHPQHEELHTPRVRPGVICNPSEPRK